jgi:hypothetical protein
MAAANIPSSSKRDTTNYSSKGWHKFEESISARFTGEFATRLRNVTGVSTEWHGGCHTFSERKIYEWMQ